MRSVTEAPAEVQASWRSAPDLKANRAAWLHSFPMSCAGGRLKRGNNPLTQTIDQIVLLRQFDLYTKRFNRTTLS